MKNIFLLMMIFGFGQIVAQNSSNLVVFSDMGEQFFAYINSVRQNDAPSSNVKITDFPAEFARLRIEFADSNLGSIDKNIMLQFGYEITAVVMLNRKGQYVLRPFGEPVAIQSAPVLDDQPVIIYHAEPTPEPVVTERPQPVRDEVSTQQVEVIQTTIQTSDIHGTDAGAAIGVQVDGIGIHMGVDIREPGIGATQGTVTTTTTTTTTTTITGTGTTERPERDRRPRPESTEHPEYEEEIVVAPLVPGYNGPIGCSSYLMSDQQFAAAKNSIGTKSFEDDKMTLARQISNNQCLTTSQVIGIMNLFTFEATKLEWAKAAYPRTHDIGNYWMLNDHFTFSSSIDDLNKFIESQR